MLAASLACRDVTPPPSRGYQGRLAPVRALVGVSVPRERSRGGAAVIVQLKRRKHGASFAHAEQALRDPIAVTVEDPDAERDRRFVTLGMDAVQAHDEIM
jgi:hypothetical protein